MISHDGTTHIVCEFYYNYFNNLPIKKFQLVDK